MILHNTPENADATCYCCNRRVADLQPFDPFTNTTGEITDCMLGKTFIDMTPKPVEEYDRILNDWHDSEEPFEDMQEKHGVEKMRWVMFYESLVGSVEKMWLCRDCWTLQDHRDALFAKMEAANTCQEKNSNKIK